MASGKRLLTTVAVDVLSLIIGMLLYSTRFSFVNLSVQSRVTPILARSV